MSEDLPDYRDSPLLQFGSGFAFKGDPQTPEDFTQALASLEVITSHFMEDGSLWMMTAEEAARAMTDELHYHNGWGRQGKGETYRETTLEHLHALSQRRIQAMEETDWHLTHYYRIVCFVDTLIGQAVAAEASLERLMHDMSASHNPAL